MKKLHGMRWRRGNSPILSLKEHDFVDREPKYVIAEIYLYFIKLYWNRFEFELAMD